MNTPEVTIVKIGGNIIDDEISLENVLNHFAAIQGAKILIHGGGKSATLLAQKLNHPQQMIEGRRVTDEETLKIAIMVYAGLINKNLVASLEARGVTSLGVTGADFNLIRSKKRNPHPIDFGLVGDILAIESKRLKQFLLDDVTLVIAPLTHDGQGQLLNTNADTIAAEVAKSLCRDFKVKLIFGFEKRGVLVNMNDENSVMPNISHSAFVDLKRDQKIVAGMIPKLTNAFQASEAGVDQVILGNALELPMLLVGRSGTRVTYES